MAEAGKRILGAEEGRKLGIRWGRQSGVSLPWQKGHVPGDRQVLADLRPLDDGRLPTHFSHSTFLKQQLKAITANVHYLESTIDGIHGGGAMLNATLERIGSSSTSRP